MLKPTEDIVESEERYIHEHFPQVSATISTNKEYEVEIHLPDCVEGATSHKLAEQTRAYLTELESEPQS